MIVLSWSVSLPAPGRHVPPIREFGDAEFQGVFHRRFLDILDLLSRAAEPEHGGDHLGCRFLIEGSVIVQCLADGREDLLERDAVQAARVFGGVRYAEFIVLGRFLSGAPICGEYALTGRSEVLSEDPHQSIMVGGRQPPDAVIAARCHRPPNLSVRICLRG